MRRIDLAEFAETVDAVIAAVEAGETVMLTRDGVDVARLEPVGQAGAACPDG